MVRLFGNDEEEAAALMRVARTEQGLLPDEIGRRDKSLAQQLCLMFTFLPFLVFLTATLIIYFLFHDYPMITFAALVLAAVCTLGIFCLPHTCILIPPVQNFIYLRILGVGRSDMPAITSRATKDNRRVANLLIRDLGFYMLVFYSGGLMCGFHNFSENSREAWAIAELHRYSNVFAGNEARGFQDATRLDFVPGTKVDTFDSVGYGYEGAVYCVAPIKDAYTGAVNFWAAGKNCCGKRGNFACGDATKAGAQSAYVFPVIDEGFRKAVRVASGVYDLTTPSDYLLVQWTSDFEAVKNKFLSDEASYSGTSTGIAFGIAILVGAFTSTARLKLVKAGGFNYY